ncbi:MAG: hypothetical protein NZM40_09130 [Sphingomonadaceae bacterium]|uniref:c-type cytochrome n=1 Tax=Thermaurantiacus sp. TaxID=2820283 RepID=UPI00298EDB7A|nr:hypothetical protein [Thermaurantiacus sp.]MCS6987570.1 hypothetical protein [Sphingomonadaceae bacterium]MDW8415171.1 hypothetical protein [Thermaurantiacus sp.]
MATQGWSRLGVVSGWSLAGLYLVHALVTTRLARTDRLLPLREELRGWHYLLGALLFAVAAVRLWAWWRERPTPPPGLPAGAFVWGRALALATLVLLFLAPLPGLLFAWADGLVVHLGGLQVPAPIGRDRALWQAAGYFHSGLAFMLLVLNLATLLSAAVIALRFGVGLRSAFPPGHGAFALLGLSSTVHAFATFRSPEPGPWAVAALWALVLAVGGLAWRWHRGRPAPSMARVASPSVRWAAGAGVAALVALGAAGPWALFRVSPVSGPADVAARDGVTWHVRPAVPRLPVSPPDAFERRVDAEVFKWCRFCHELKPGRGAHKVGPNLYNIMGQRAGTVPGFAYSDAMRQARARGLVWTEEAIAAYVADPQKFLPGTTMIVSSGPITDVRVQRAILNILKRETQPPEAGAQTSPSSIRRTVAQ